jgi:transcriptional regulator with XRE-family HTH domain
MQPMQLGEKIRRARQAQGLTQRQLAAKIGIWPAVLCHWELDARSPNIDSLMRVAIALGVPAASLLPD